MRVQEQDKRAFPDLLRRKWVKIKSSNVGREQVEGIEGEE